MRNYILTLVSLIVLVACNETKTPAADTTQGGDSIVQVRDSGKNVRTEYSIGSGLTLEELKDDTVFADGSKPTTWEAAGFTDVKGFKLFVKKLQLLVLDNDKEQLAKLIRYPLNKSIKSTADFIKNYDSIFTKDVKLSIAAINFSQIFRNSKGAMSEGGMVWFSQIENEFRIIAVNTK